MPVHLFGRPAPLAELAELGLPIVEDAAQAFGAAGVAQTGVASTFSFFPTKNLFCLGDGGLIAVRDEELAERIRLLRFHGSKAKKDFHYVGYNSRLDELQAAVLRVFLRELDGWNEARREAAARYAELGLGEGCELPSDEPAHVYHMFVVRSPDRDRIAEALKAAEIACASYYVTPASSPACAPLPRLPGGRPPRHRAGRAREPRAAALGGHRRRCAGEGRRDRARSCRHRRLLKGSRDLPDQPPSALAARG